MQGRFKQNRTYRSHNVSGIFYDNNLIFLNVNFNQLKPSNEDTSFNSILYQRFNFIDNNCSYSWTLSHHVDTKTY